MSGFGLRMIVVLTLLPTLGISMESSGGVRNDKRRTATPEDAAKSQVQEIGVRNSKRQQKMRGGNTKLTVEASGAFRMSEMPTDTAEKSMSAEKLDACQARKRALVGKYSRASIEANFEDLKRRKESKCVLWRGLYGATEAKPNDYWARKDCTEAFADGFEGAKLFSKKNITDKDMENLWGVDPSRDKAWDRTKVGNMIFNAHYQDDILLSLLFFSQPHVSRGTFVEFGAWDGVKHSTTAAFERNFNWTGLLLEPSSCAEKVRRNRPNAQTIKGAICEQPGIFKGKNFAECRAEEVPCAPLQHYFDLHGISHVDLLSADTEGHEVVDVRTIDYDKTSVSVIMVEENGHASELKDFFGQKGYHNIELRGLPEPGAFWDLVFWSPSQLVKTALEREGC
jgi:hypothetical protein